MDDFSCFQFEAKPDGLWCNSSLYESPQVLKCAKGCYHRSTCSPKADKNHKQVAFPQKPLENCCREQNIMR